MPTKKTFSVFLPVRNGGEHLKQCVASILAQTLHDDFDLVILDNASTDGTSEWLATLDDPRLRLSPATRPLSIEENWARIKDLPKNEFITVIGHDDLLDPQFLKLIHDLIEKHPTAGLYLSHFHLIDDRGRFLRHCRPMPAQETAAEFLAARLCDLRDSFGTGHVLRSANYDAIGGIPQYPKLLFADDALFLKAIGSSYRATASGAAFSYRVHTGSTSGAADMGHLIDALEQYLPELVEMGRHDTQLQTMLDRHGQAYILSICAQYYGWTLLGAQRATALPKAVDRIQHLLRTIAPEKDLLFQSNPHARMLARAQSSLAGKLKIGVWSLWKQGRPWLQARLTR